MKIMYALAGTLAAFPHAALGAETYECGVLESSLTGAVTVTVTPVAPDAHCTVEVAAAVPAGKHTLTAFGKSSVAGGGAHITFSFSVAPQN